MNAGYDPEKHHRRSIRLQGYDYSQINMYFVTVCSQNRRCIFGDVVQERMRLNDAGQMVERWYRELEYKFPDIRGDIFVCMPNHIHFIIANVGVDVGADLCVRPQTEGEHPGSPLRRVI